ncbi:MAG: phosphodiester glycosidase family protein, partial [Gemmatimonadaceae bacterium]|nr:phosphodiester glycosidase family protein [Gemmatimonadaceae bacterium]
MIAARGRATIMWLLLTASLLGAPRAADAQLRVRDAARDGEWREWWHPAQAPSTWSAAHPVITAALHWRPMSPGIEMAELSLASHGEAWRIRAVLVRIDPASVRLMLDADVADDGRIRPWTITATPDARKALLALNAGQFTDAGPWGWLVHEGRELQAPGSGSLAGAVVVDSAGRIRVVEAGVIPSLRGSAARSRTVEAVQSYPMLLHSGGVTPRALQPGQRDVRVAEVDLDHRDARLAVGELRDGRIVVALTRFDALGSLLGAVPFGLTVPEMSALMGALGCTRALMLDGGISAQLAVAD